MSKKTITWLIVAGVILILIIWPVVIYNKMVNGDEQTAQAWSQVENVYQRRADLISNLVKTVQGAADFEKGTLEAVIEARSQATSMKIDPANMTQENLV